MTPSITEDAIMTVLGDFLTRILPPGTQVFVGQENRVPEPAADNFVVMTSTARNRLSRNTDSYTDITMTGAIAGTVLTITHVTSGAIGIGSPVFGVGVAAGTVIIALGTGTGGLGTYTVAPSQTVGSELLAFGVTDTLTPTQASIQLDVHGEASSDNVQVIMGTFWDAYCCDFFTAAGLDMQPLYAGDPIQAPFLNAENQYEDRWTLNVLIQINAVVSTPMQFATTLTLDVIEVDATYPP